ncbi:MAG: zinc ribbon domain-containing protein [Prevotella sp.]
MLVKCHECGTLVSDKALKCPKCGKVLVQEKPEVIEYDGVVKILNKVADIRTKFPSFWVKVSVFPDNFAIDPLIEVITDSKNEFDEDLNNNYSCPASNSPAYFESIICTEFPNYSIRKDVPVTDLAGKAEDKFRLYKTRPEQVYKAEWGQPYSFVLYKNNKPEAVVMLGDGYSHNKNVKYLISRMYAKKLDLPYINFYTQFPNTRIYVINRLNRFLNCDASRACDLFVQINEDDLKKMNLVESFKSLDYSAEFKKNVDSSGTFKWVKVNNTKFAAKIVYELLTKVYGKRLESARFVITGVEDNENSAKYNSQGAFLEGKGYGQGEFAYYKETSQVNAVQHFSGNDVQQEGQGGFGQIIWWIICIIGALIWIFS